MANSYVIQHHVASTDHFDLRLEIDGVMRSFAVPKGLGTSRGDVRLAVPTPDHEMDYLLEGVIAPGNYGAGTVQLFDVGTYELKDPIEPNKINFYLDGHRYGGYFSLIKGVGDNWMLLSHEVDVRYKPDISVLTGRSMEEIFNHLPLKPQLALMVGKLPVGDDYVYEVKHDGKRLVAERNPLQVYNTSYPGSSLQNTEHHVRLTSRNGHDWTQRYPHIVQEIERLGITGYMDGEIVYMEDGISDFSKLTKNMDHRTVYMVWDKPDHPGRLLERKAYLKSLVAGSDVLVYTEHSDKYFDPCSMYGVEGAVAKNKNCFYQPGVRSDCWQKIKCRLRQEFTVTKCLPGEGKRAGLCGAFELGYYDENGEIQTVGNIGTGWNKEDLVLLSAPFLGAPSSLDSGALPGGKPGLVQPVVEVEFLGWTKNSKLRHPAFKGIRDDKDPREVVLETMPQGGLRSPQLVMEDLDRTGGQGLLPKVALLRVESLRPHLQQRGLIYGFMRAVSSRQAQGTMEDPTNPLRTIRLGFQRLWQNFRQTSPEVTHPDKILFPDQGVTKEGLARYYQKVASGLVPEIQDRPLTLVRCPNGVKEECFIQRNANHLEAPPGLRIVDIEGREYFVLGTKEGLQSLAQLNVVEIHPWNAKVGQQPDRMIFDLDPGKDATWDQVVRAAQDVKKELDTLGIKSSVRTTGGKGLHVVAEVENETFGSVRARAKSLAEGLAKANPSLYTASPASSKRDGKVYIDWLRNDAGSTSIAAWSPRMTGFVATPVSWDDLSKIVPETFSLVPDKSYSALTSLFERLLC